MSAIDYLKGYVNIFEAEEGTESGDPTVFVNNPGAAQYADFDYSLVGSGATATVQVWKLSGGLGVTPGTWCKGWELSLTEGAHSVPLFIGGGTIGFTVTANTGSLTGKVVLK